MKPGFFLRQRVLGYLKQSQMEPLAFWKFKYMRNAVEELETPQAKRLAANMLDLSKIQRDRKLTETLAFIQAKRMVEEYLK